MGTITSTLNLNGNMAVAMERINKSATVLRDTLSKLEKLQMNNFATRAGSTARQYDSAAVAAARVAAIEEKTAQQRLWNEERIRASQETTALARERHMEKVKQHETEAAARAERLKNKTDEAAASAKRLSKAWLGVVAAIVSGRAIQNLVNQSDELTSFTARITLLADDDAAQADIYSLRRQVMDVANDTRSEFADTAEFVTRLGINAGNAFTDTDELLKFTSLLNKQFTIAGTKASEIASVQLQLSQAMAANVLQGEELRSIRKNAPMLAAAIEDYVNATNGTNQTIKEMGEEGLITADVIKTAMFNAADEINNKFSNMPYTWAQRMAMFKNSAVQAFTPLIMTIRNLAQNDELMAAINNIIVGLGQVSMALIPIINGAAMVVTFIGTHWDVLGPIIMGLAAAISVLAGRFLLLYVGKTVLNVIRTSLFLTTLAQYGLNAAIKACPITWIIMLIIAVIAVLSIVIKHINKVAGTSLTVAGVVCGALNVVLQFLINCFKVAFGIVQGFWAIIGTVASNIPIAFGNAIAKVQGFFYGLAATVANVMADIAAELNKLPFISFDYSGVTSAADKYAAKQAKANDKIKEYNNVHDAMVNAYNSAAGDAFSSGWVKKAWDTGNKFGDNLQNKLVGATKGGYAAEWANNGYNAALGGSDALNNIAGNTSDIAKNTGKSVEISEEDLQYLHDIAEQTAINRFTSVNLEIPINNAYTNGEDVDIDGIVSRVTDALTESIYSGAEMAHA